VGAPGRPPKVCLFDVGASSIGFGGVSGAELIGGKLWPVPMPPVGLVLLVGTELAVGGGLLGADFSGAASELAVGGGLLGAALW
jgi:hypothetical protein